MAARLNRHSVSAQQNCREGWGIIAKKHGVTTAYIRTRSRLAFLSPKIQQAIVTGTLDPKFTTRHIMGMKIPSDWQSQEALFGL